MTVPARHERFLRELAEALHASGAPAHDLEHHVVVVGRALGLSVHGFALPTMLTIAIDDENENGQQHIQMRRLPPSDYNLTRLMALETLVAQFSGPEMFDAAEHRLQAIRDQPPPWRGLPLALFGGLLSGAVAALFKGGYLNMACGGVLGVLFVLALMWCARRPQLGPVAPFLLCVGAALLAHLFSMLFSPQSPFITVLSGIVLLLPGFTLTIAMSELATQNLLAGAGRLAGAFMLLMMMGAGVAVGTHLGHLVWPTPLAGSLSVSATPVPDVVVWLSVAALGFALVGLLQAPLRAGLIAAFASLVAWTVLQPANALLGPIGGALVAAVVVTSGGHLYQRLRGKPALLFQLPGLLTLVPGSVGFRGLDAFIQNDFLTGIKATTEMVLTATALAVGMLLAHSLMPLIVPSRRRNP